MTTRTQLPSFTGPGAIGAMLAMALGLLALWSRLGDGLVEMSYDSLFRFRDPVPVEGVTILYMDLESETRLDQKGHASWSREIHARMLDRLREFHPRAVVFDVLFVPSHDDPDADAQLVRAARACGNVIVAAKPAADFLEGERVGWQVTLPFPQLREVVSWGIAEAAQDDRSIRQHYHRVDLDMPSMAWRVAERTMTHPPTAAYAPRWINYYGPPGSIRHYSCFETFETNRIPVAALSNQVVFVGALYDIGFTGGKRSDDFRTPYTALTRQRSSGVEITATTYLNLVRGDSLRRPARWMETCLVALCGAVLGFGLTRCRPLAAAGLGALAFLLVAGVAILVAWQQHVFFSWLMVSAVQIPGALAWSVLAQTGRLLREKKALEQALALSQAGTPTAGVPQPARPRTGAAPASESSADVPPRPATAGPLPMPARDRAWSPIHVGSSTGPSEPVHRLAAQEQVTLVANAESKPTVPDHELVRCIGRGAYGEVWLARDIIGTYHAVKLIYRNKFPDAVPFDREFNGIRRFTPISRSHPGFVNVLHVGRNEPGDYLYYVMELGDDENTGQTINPQTYSAKNLGRELHRRGRLPLAECLQLSVQLADALEYLHGQQLIHRDIKPSNIIYVKGAPKFADVGLVTEVAGEGRDVTYLGTMGYIAPEGPGTPAADVFSLGRVIYEAGFGIEAGRFPDLPTTMVNNPGSDGLFQLNRIVLKACEHETQKRYRSAAELRTALEGLVKRIEARA